MTTADELDISDLTPEDQALVQDAIRILVAHPDDVGMREQLGLMFSAFQRDQLTREQWRAWVAQVTA